MVPVSQKESSRYEQHPGEFSVAALRLARNDRFFADVILEVRRDEESRSGQEVPLMSKNEILRFAQHDMFPQPIISSLRRARNDYQEDHRC